MLRNIILIVSFLFSALAFAEPESPIVDYSSRFSFGLDIDSFANNYGIGISLGSPAFADDTMHVQLSANVAWAEGVANGYSTDSWNSYGLFRVGLYGGHFISNLPIRIYGGFGFAMTALAPSLSTSNVGLGGYGLSGVEFFLNPTRSRAFTIELGGMGTGATADKMAASPSYANGFTIAWGYKYYL